MANALEETSPSGGRSRGAMTRSASSGKLRATGQSALASSGGLNGETVEAPQLPRYLSVSKLTKTRKLAASTGNIHGYMAEDYHQLSWPLPKMFGEEKYGFSLIDIEDPRYLKPCADMSKKLVRLHYDQQIIDNEWRKTYKILLDAEHRVATLGSGMPQNRTYNPENHLDKTKKQLQEKVDHAKQYLLQLQEQKDQYEREVKEAYARCDQIKATIKKENDLEELRLHMENRAKASVSESTLWRKFNARSAQPKASGVTSSIVDLSNV